MNRIVPYFKQTKKMHHSGLHRLEIGYIDLDSEEKTILQDGADTVRNFMVADEEPLGIALHVTAGGEVIILPRLRDGEKVRWWGCGSNVFLKIGDPQEHMKEVQSE